jgi:hypothetical protein
MIIKRSVVQIEDNRVVVVKEDGAEQEDAEGGARDSTAEFYERFWREFLDKHLHLSDSTQPTPAGGRSTNLYFPMPPSGSQAWISTFVAPASRKAGVSLTFARGGFAEAAYAYLQADREQIDREIGEPIQWSSKNGKHWVVSDISMTDLSNPEEAKRVYAFLAAKVNKFVTVFRPRLRKVADT